jgi:hypothetical protein
MDNRVGLIFFAIFVLLFAFAFVFGWVSFDASENNVLYGVLAMVGFVVVLAGSLINGGIIRTEGGALSVWYFSLSIFVGITFVWYMTRCGTAFGWWT